MAKRNTRSASTDFSPLARLGAIIGVAILTAIAFGGMLAGLSALGKLVVMAAADTGLSARLVRGLVRFFYSPFFVVVPLATGVALFRLRGSAPLQYGMVEVLVALATLAVLAAQRDANLLQHALALTGGTYVLIRGMDNIERGLSPHHRAIWLQIFPKKPSTG